jgi:uncharacterized membrane protein
MSNNEQQSDLARREPQKLEGATQTEQVIGQFHRHSGPLPPPEVLQGYENITPGFADRIVTMAEKQAQHRQELEKIAYKSESRNSFTGVIMAGVVVVSITISAILTGNAILGGILGSAGLAGLAGTFIYGTRVQQQQQKRLQPPPQPQQEQE